MQLFEFIDKLKLTSYEREIIIYLARIQVAGAKEIYENTAVPKGRIYQVLSELQHKGFITIIPTTPKKYSIKDIKTVLKSYIDTKKTELEEQEQEIDALEFEPIYKESQNEPSVNIMTGREEHLNGIAFIRNGAQEELLQVAPSFIGSMKSKITLKRALNRGVNVQVITLKHNEKNHEMIKTCIENGGEVRELKQAIISMLIRDSKDFLLGVQDKERKEERMTIYSKNKGLLKILKESFQKMWEEAKPVNIAEYQ